ncbi:MAG: cobyrinate a,c-diamide synthase [Oligoflexia bacterium]|nr:cobyrinate a,c-diamide synthase [Oligoflexia bacterium]
MKQTLNSNIPRVVIAGTHSGVGKTSLVIGLLKYFKEQGLNVAAFKCGPDYLDPTYYEKILGRKAHNLDSWFMKSEDLIATFCSASAGCDLAIIEGVMGLYDGKEGDLASTAEIAKILKAPVVVVADVSGMSRTLAAIIYGLKHFDNKINLAGVIANRIGSVAHLQLLKAEVATIAPIIGGVPKLIEALPERHLGLVWAFDHDHTAYFDALSTAVANYVDTAALLAIAKEESASLPLASYTSAKTTRSESKIKINIALAYDKAFHFYYQYNLHRLEECGAKITLFSPLEDIKLPAHTDALILGGGYPELYAKTLSENLALHDSILEHAYQKKIPIYAECGGLIYLSSKVRLLEGSEYNFLGLLPFTIEMQAKLQALGYVEATLATSDTFLGAKGTKLRGHQFRYSHIISGENDPTITHAYLLKTRKGTTSEGYLRTDQGIKLFASYLHAHWSYSPSVANSFIRAVKS